jgi:hypothetical protein
MGWFDEHKTPATVNGLHFGAASAGELKINSATNAANVLLNIEKSS